MVFKTFAFILKEDNFNIIFTLTPFFKHGPEKKIHDSLFLLCDNKNNQLKLCLFWSFLCFVQKLVRFYCPKERKLRSSRQRGKSRWTWTRALSRASAWLWATNDVSTRETGRGMWKYWCSVVLISRSLWTQRHYKSMTHANSSYIYTGVSNCECNFAFTT